MTSHELEHITGLVVTCLAAAVAAGLVAAYIAWVIGGRR